MRRAFVATYFDSVPTVTGPRGTGVTGIVPGELPVHYLLSDSTSLAVP